MEQADNESGQPPPSQGLPLLSKEKVGVTSPASSVWPPPPNVDLVWSGTFKEESKAIYGTMSDLRSGDITVDQSGLSISGKAVIASEIQVPIVALSLLMGPLFFVASIVLEFAIRRQKSLFVRWEDVKAVALPRSSNIVCFAFHALNYKGKDKQFSLAFKVNEAQADLLRATVTQHAPKKITRAVMRDVTHPHVTLFFGAFALVIAVPLLLAAIEILGRLSAKVLMGMFN